MKALERAFFLLFGAFATGLIKLTNMSKFTPVQRTLGNLTAQGLHRATIELATETVSKTGGPQLEISWVAEDNTKRKAWMNLVGYKKNEAKQFVDRKGEVIAYEGLEGPMLIKAMSKRVEDPEATAKCNEMIGNLMFDLGVTEECNDIPELCEALIGKQGLICVIGDSTDGHIEYVYPIDKVAEAQKLMTKKLGFEVEVNEPEEA